MFLIVWLLYDTFNTSCSWVDEYRVLGMSASNNVPGYAIFQLYRGGQFYWWRKPDYPEKTTDLQKVRQTLSHNV